MGKMQAFLDKLLYKMMDMGGSDLHIKATAPVRLRVSGLLEKITEKPLSPEHVEGILKDITDEAMMKKFKEHKSLDFTYVLDNGKGRFRVNAFYQMYGISIVMRIIPVKIPRLEDLKVPMVLKNFADVQRGLVLVTGVTGSGKSTTLAAIINEINEKYAKHIITLEDPIEFVHPDKKSLINQRSIGQDSNSFGDALPAALREDPDIILVGEMRDLETIDLALHAANTGHLVFSTLHTLDAKETINRIVGTFPEAEQNRIRIALASVIQGIISQRLVRSKDGGRRAVQDILVRTPRIEELIMQNRDFEIPDAMAEGKETYGSQTFDQHLYDLVQEGAITEEVALENATSPDDLKLKFEGIGTGGGTENIDKTELDAFDFKDDEEEEKD